MTNQEIAAHRFNALLGELDAFAMREWATMTDGGDRDAQEQEIKDRHGFRHGWIVVNGQSFNMELAFPDQRFPCFPADQGLSD